MTHTAGHASSGSFDVRMTVKRVLDVVLSSILLLLLAPFLVAIGLAIRIDSPGPALFRQWRVGQHRRQFVLFKFRTMAEKADNSIHRMAVDRVWAGELLSNDPKSPYKLTSDPRVTRVGRVLRRTSIDELPQLFNVLCGDMSLVGPRPMIPYELRYLEEWHNERHHMRPGLTGKAQVYCRGRSSMEEMLRADIDYVENFGLLIDLKLLLLTIPAVLRGAGAR